MIARNKTASFPFYMKNRWRNEAFVSDFYALFFSLSVAFPFRMIYNRMEWWLYFRDPDRTVTDAEVRFARFPTQQKKRATPARKLLALQAVCSPIQVWLVSQQCKRRGWFCAISYGTKKAPTNRSLELMMGLEPMTCWLRINCSTDWATLAKGASEFCYIIITYKIRFVNIKMKFF